MDSAVMVCKECGCQDFEVIYQIVWMAADHPGNTSEQARFYPSLHKYACKKCGGENAVLPPGFEEMRARIKAAQHPMSVISNDEDEELNP